MFTIITCIKVKDLFSIQVILNIAETIQYLLVLNISFMTVCIGPQHFNGFFTSAIIVLTVSLFIVKKLKNVHVHVLHFNSSLQRFCIITDHFHELQVGLFTLHIDIFVCIIILIIPKFCNF